MKKPTLDLRIVLVAVLLAVLTLLVFSQVFKCDFVNYDDDKYVTNNDFVKAGLTKESVKWALTATYEATWQPMIWLSYMLDIQLFGLNARGFHATNLLFHIANVILLFLVLRRMTRSLWKSAVVAALFAVHPLHVESVAWVAERKDVLSTFFWMLTMLAYLLYVERPNLKRYLAVVVLFALGLMAKPMLVTLPFVLLLMDYWPLGRVQIKIGKRTSPVLVFWRLVWEKLPLFALSLGSSTITSIAQMKDSAIASWEAIPFGVRVANALVSYVSYIIKTLWPTKLAPFYPHLGAGLPMWQVAGSAVLLVCVTLAIVAFGRSRPYLAVGWLWYLGTLMPTIGILQTGMHAMADRFAYIPLIGIFVMIAWGVPDLWRRVGERESGSKGDGETGRRGDKGTWGLAAAAGIVIVVLAALTWRQVGYWQNGISLFRHTTAVTKDNYIAHSNLGAALMDSGDVDGAISELKKSIRIAPLPGTYYNLARALALQGKFQESAAVYTESLRGEPDNAEAHYNLGTVYNRLGRLHDAAREYREAIRINPDYAIAHASLATVLEKLGRRTEAMSESLKAESLNPRRPEIHYDIGVTLQKQGKMDAAIREYREAIRLQPDFVPAHNNLAIALFLTGDLPGAWNEVHECRKYDIEPHPGFIQALSEKMPDPGR